MIVNKFLTIYELPAEWLNISLNINQIALQMSSFHLRLSVEGDLDQTWSSLMKF